MLMPFVLPENSDRLWAHPFCAVPLTEIKDGYSALFPNGVELTCKITKEGEVYHRRDTIRNTGDAPYLCDGIAARFVFDGGRYEAYTQFCTNLAESSGAWQMLNTTVEAHCVSSRTSRNAAPMLALWDCQCDMGTVFHLLPKSTWRLAATRIREIGKWQLTEVTAGFAGALILEPGESVELPEILYYTAGRKLDLDAWKLHRWFHENVPAKPMPLLYNTWLYRFDAFTPEGLLQQVDAAAELGLEYFVVDAGWFGEKGLWSKTVGSWVESKNSATEGRLAEIADRVREKGMLFGLWMELERAGADAPILQSHPEYYVTRGAKHQLDYRRADARAYMLDVLEGLIEKYGIRYFKFDNNGDHLAFEGDRQLLDYFAGVDIFMRELRTRHPELHLECCASGGLRMNLRTAIDYDSMWISDNQSFYSGMDIYKNSLLRLPPQVMERWCVAQELRGSAPSHQPPFVRDQLIAADDSTYFEVKSVTPEWVEGFLTGSVMGFSCDLTTFSPETFAFCKDFVSRYKKDRAFWQSAECRILADTGEILVLQYNDRAFSEIRLMVYAEKTVGKTVTVYPITEGGRGEPVRVPLKHNGDWQQVILK